MKLEKFKAASMAEAMSMIEKKFGSEAVIYFQSKTIEGIEVIAGLNGQPTVKKTATEVEKSPESLLERVTALDNTALNKELRRIEKQHLLIQRMRQLKFSFEFIEDISNHYLLTSDIDEIANDDVIIKLLLSRLQIEEDELINTRKVCALVGPTGIGKSTTIAKLARRFVAHHGASKLGIISTDFQRIIAKNQFNHFGKLLNISVEYAQNAIELREALHIFADKQLVLIDTAGVNQNDNQKLAALFERLSNDGEAITTYLVAPCTLQSDILEDVVTKFKMSHTAGCIITKIDEGKTISPCLSVIMRHSLPIAYWCNGQNIVRDIAVPSKPRLIEAIFQGERRDAQVFVPT